MALSYGDSIVPFVFPSTVSPLWSYWLPQDIEDTPRIAMIGGKEHVILCCAERTNGLIILNANDGTVYWRPKLKLPLHQCLRCEVALGGTQVVLYSFAEPSSVVLFNLSEKRYSAHPDILPAIYPPSLSVCENRLYIVQDAILTVLDLGNNLAPLVLVDDVDSGESRAPYRISTSSSFAILERHGSITCVSVSDSAAQANQITSNSTVSQS